jgi:ADP-dependent NAD(P)H-hydrate dehydratase / NAD(P)H-hydrate epimerase
VKKVLTAAEMREVDRLTAERCAFPSLLLMENAARCALREVAARCAGGSVAGRRALILCGRGNNGGDGAALARLLALEGAEADVVLAGRIDETKGDARINFATARALGMAGKRILRKGSAADVDADNTSEPSLFANTAGSLSFTECANRDEWERFLDERGASRSYDIYVDALFGTGLTRPVEGLHREMVLFLRGLREERDASESNGADNSLFVSLDVPSGLDADSGQLIGDAVRADLTVTFTAPKAGNVLAPAASLNGELIIADIGSPLRLIDEASSKLFLTTASDAARWLRLTRYTPESYKNTHGHALIVAGSRDMAGAAVLCADAAMRAGAGLVTLATPASALPSIAARLMPEIMTAPLAETKSGAASAEAFEQIERLAARATVVAAGCGLSRTAASTGRFVRELATRGTLPLVLDADGLNAMAPWPADLRGTPDRPIILTPHEGEMLRLLGTKDHAALTDRARSAAEFAEAHNLVLVLKGTRTLVAAPDGRVFVNPTGNAGLGTAGSGDTLTGVITGFLAQAYATLGERADAVAATIAAVYVAGLAGDFAARERGMRTLVASDVRNYLGAAVRALDAAGEHP